MKESKQRFLSTVEDGLPQENYLNTLLKNGHCMEYQVTKVLQASFVDSNSFLESVIPEVQRACATRTSMKQSIIVTNFQKLTFLNEKILKRMFMEVANKVAILENVPFAHSTVNDNYLYFPKAELQRAINSMNGKPVVINLDGRADSDHVTNSSMYTVGWTKNSRVVPMGDIDEAVCDVEITDPTVIEKIQRQTTEGKRELNAVSMGAMMKTTCSICNQSMIEGHEHMRGEMYDGKMAFAIASETEFNHLALTNFQADKLSILDKAKFSEVEVASRRYLECATLKINSWRVKKMSTATIAPQAAADAPVQPPMAQAPNAPSSMEERMQKIEALCQMLVDKYAGQASAQKNAAEAPVDEKTDEEKKKQNMYASKYRTKLISELAGKLNKKTIEFEKESIESLETISRTVDSMAPSRIPQFASTIQKSGKAIENDFASMTAMERADKFGNYQSLELAAKQAELKID